MIWKTDENRLKRLNAFERQQMLAHVTESKDSQDTNSLPPLRGLQKRYGATASHRLLHGEP
jgi:hypothetical protein